MCFFELFTSQAVVLNSCRIFWILSAIPLDVTQGGTASAKNPNYATCFTKFLSVSPILLIFPPIYYKLLFLYFICEEFEFIFLWAFKGLQRLVKNDFRFPESDQTHVNREAVKKDANNTELFLESKGYITP